MQSSLQERVEQAAKTAGSYTGEVLKPVLARAKAAPTRASSRKVT